jgi:hypothetical protein
MSAAGAFSMHNELDGTVSSMARESDRKSTACSRFSAKRVGVVRGRGGNLRKESERYWSAEQTCEEKLATIAFNESHQI